MYRLRLGEAPTGLDEAAAGSWPTYTQAGAQAGSTSASQ
jgi:hypothetical protein